MMVISSNHHIGDSANHDDAPCTVTANEDGTTVTGNDGMTTVTGNDGMTMMATMMATMMVLVLRNMSDDGNTSDYMTTRDNLTTRDNVSMMVVLTLDEALYIAIGMAVVKVNAIASLIKTPNLRRWNSLRRHCD
jgi:hypothetical protein